MLNIILLGFVSFFVDTSTEMVYPLIPLYLTSVLGATPALVGVIEGIAESLASLLKVYSGYLSDKYKHKKALAFAGYSTSILYKLALLLSSTWVGILFARVLDRFGKGVRTAPRDVLVAENAEKGKMGKAFGLHKMIDMAGASFGILIAYFLLQMGHGKYDYHKIFILSIVPAAIGLVILLFVKEKKAPPCASQKPKLSFQFSKLDTRLKLFLVVAFLFTLGNSSNVFLLLRAQNSGFSESSVILLYLLYNVVASAFALPLGRLSDKIGRKRLLVAGYLAYGIVYFGFAAVQQKGFMVALFFLYGIYTAATAGVERALISEISPPELKGTMLGLHSSLVGIALLPASMIAGFLWDIISPAAPFYLGGALALLSSLAIYFILHEKKTTGIGETS